MKKEKTYFSRQKIDTIIQKLKKDGMFDCFKKFEICGSYRRGASKSSDIDIVYVAEDNFDIEESFRKRGYKHYSTAFADKTIIDDVPVEFFKAREDNYWLNVFFWTGSAVSNYVIKAEYFSHGFLISPYGVYDLEAPSNGKSNYEFKDEQEIYNLVGKEYISPSMR